MIMIAFGLADVFGSYAFGYIIKFVGRIPIFFLGALMNYEMISLMIWWHPNPDQTYVLYVIAILWGLSDAM